MPTSLVNQCGALVESLRLFPCDVDLDLDLDVDLGLDPVLLSRLIPIVGQPDRRLMTRRSTVGHKRLLIRHAKL